MIHQHQLSQLVFVKQKFWSKMCKEMQENSENSFCFMYLKGQNKLPNGSPHRTRDEITKTGHKTGVHKEKVHVMNPALLFSQTQAQPTGLSAPTNIGFHLFRTTEPRHKPKDGQMKCKGKQAEMALCFSSNMI